MEQVFPSVIKCFKVALCKQYETVLSFKVSLFIKFVQAFKKKKKKKKVLL